MSRPYRLYLSIQVRSEVSDIYLKRCRELASMLRELGALAEPVEIEATRTDVLCFDVLRMTEAAHAVAAEVLRECGSP